MNTTCIYPGPHGKMSKEHFLPEALGTFAGCELLLNRVCRLCNKKIGDETETQFLRAGTIGFFRWLTGIEGKDGLPPSPFYRGAGGAPPIYMLGRLREFPFDLLFESYAGTQDVFPLRQIIFEHPLVGRVPIPILDRMHNHPEVLIENLNLRGLRNATPIHAFADPDEIPWVTDLLKSIGALPSEDWITTDFEPQSVSLIATVTVTEAHFRAVAKIAFHFVLKMFLDFTGKEQEFNDIKQFIWQGGKGDHFVQQSANQYIENFRRGFLPTHWSHILTVTRGASGIIVQAQFFCGPKHLSHPYVIRVGPNPNRIISRTEKRAIQFVILKSDPSNGPIGEMVDLQPANYVFPGNVGF